MIALAALRSRRLPRSHMRKMELNKEQYLQLPVQTRVAVGSDYKYSRGTIVMAVDGDVAQGTSIDHGDIEKAGVWIQSQTLDVADSCRAKWGVGVGSLPTNPKSIKREFHPFYSLPRSWLRNEAVWSSSVPGSNKDNIGITHV